jgi:hypothetical protein
MLEFALDLLRLLQVGLQLISLRAARIVKALDLVCFVQCLLLNQAIDAE